MTPRLSKTALTPRIRTERLLLRGFEARDYPGYRAYYTGDRTSGVGGPLPEYRTFERFASMIGHWDMRGFGRFAVTDPGDGPAFGHVGPMQLIDEADPEMTWTIWDGDRCGQGFATEAAQAVMAYFATCGWTRMVAVVDAENAPSLKLATRLGGVEQSDIPPPAHLPRARVFLLRPRALQ